MNLCIPPTSVLWVNATLALLKKKYVDAFYTINRKVKIKYGCRNGQETTETSHEKNLIEAFGIDIKRTIDEEYESNINQRY